MKTFVTAKKLAKNEVNKIEKNAKTFTFIRAVRDCVDFSIITPFNGSFNRKVNKSIVAEIAEKIKNNGFIGYITLIETIAFGKLELRIVDGQHRFEAAKLFNLPFNYEVIRLEEDTKENVDSFISGANSVGSKWSNENHLKTKVDLCIPEYKLFRKCLDESNLKFTDLFHIFLGGAGAKEIKMFRSGKMKFEDLNASLRMYESMKKMSANLPDKAFSRRAVYKVWKVVKNPFKIEDLVLGTNKLVKIENEKELELELRKLYDKVA